MGGNACQLQAYSIYILDHIWLLKFRSEKKIGMLTNRNDEPSNSISIDFQCFLSLSDKGKKRKKRKKFPFVFSSPSKQIKGPHKK